MKLLCLVVAAFMAGIGTVSTITFIHQGRTAYAVAALVVTLLNLALVLWHAECIAADLRSARPMPKPSRDFPEWD